MWPMRREDVRDEQLIRRALRSHARTTGVGAVAVATLINHHRRWRYCDRRTSKLNCKVQEPVWNLQHPTRQAQGPPNSTPGRILPMHGFDVLPVPYRERF